MHAYIHTYIHTYLLRYIHTYIHTYIHAYIHTYVRTYVHTTYIHTYIHTYIRTYIHSYRQIRHASSRIQLCAYRQTNRLQVIEAAHIYIGINPTHSTYLCSLYHPQCNQHGTDNRRMLVCLYNIHHCGSCVSSHHIRRYLHWYQSHTHNTLFNMENTLS